MAPTRAPRLLTATRFWATAKAVPSSGCAWARKPPKPISAQCSRMSTRRPASRACAPPAAEWPAPACPASRSGFTAVFNDFGVEQSEVVGDEVIALDAAFHGGPGILQIAGTGSNTIGRAPDGSRESAGGWSSRLGDEGSGYWIGLHSVRRALRAYDREQPTRILEKVGEIWGTPDLDELVNLGDSTPGPDFAALAPAINELAEAGDPVALDVLRQASADLVEFVLLVRDKAAPQTRHRGRSSRGLDRRRD